VIQFLKDVFALRQVIYEAFRMWLEHPAPIEAPELLPPPQIDELESWQVRLDAPAPELREDAPIAPNDEAVVVPAEPRSRLVEASEAIAEREPWWLADAAPAAPIGEDTIPLPEVTAQPSDADRSAAAIAGIWIGAHALAISAPQIPAEERAKDPRRTKLRLKTKPGEE
jgi:hypothetical protein